ncbi:MAG TPA: ABC transporter permease [Solirubrobacteraceae bacterium]|jgi:simple sugar transport system permease protein|nr:ABC transporter permease [Solirubrobacteraceae bacterium]
MSTTAQHTLPERAPGSGRRNAGLARVDWRRVAIVLGAYFGCLILFGAVVALKGASPTGVYNSLIHSALLGDGSLSEVIVRAVPIALAALAVSVPAKAGLVNVGGEGQLIVGAIAASGIGVFISGGLPGPVGWVLMAVGGMAAGALWAGIPAVLRTGLSANEAVTTLLMNFVANDLMLYLIYQPWKDPTGGGQPQSSPLPGGDVLPSILGSTINLAAVVALVVAIGVWGLLKRTGFGFALRVVGGNQKAAHRAGLPVNRLMVSSMLVGGALAGLGGMLNLAGSQIQLVPGGTATYGYIGFLAAFLGRHDPLKVVLAALVFSAIAIGNSGLELNYGLDGSVVDVLLALLVVAPLWLSRNRKEAF